MNGVTHLQGLNFGLVNFEEKEKNFNDLIKIYLNRCLAMFKYTNLPDTIPQEYLELYLLKNGHCAIIKDKNDKLIATWGNFGAEPNEYYIPKEYLITNPYLKISKTEYDVAAGDIAVIKNDPLFVGILPILRKYLSLITENELSINLAIINTRIQQIISADDDATKASAELYLKRVNEGKQGVISSNAFLKGLNIIPTSGVNSNSAIQALIELEQYLKASLFNELGLNANYNMKRESLNSNESQLNDDMLRPLIDVMFEARKTNCDLINSKFDTNISVELSSTWKEMEEDDELQEQVDKFKKEGEEDDETDNGLLQDEQ